MQRVLITAGSTHEPIDRVRYIANRSSGRMGVALARAALERGWKATLLLGPVSQALELPEHSHLRIVRFQTTADLQVLLREHWPMHDVLLMAAAVADFTPIAFDPSGKLERAGGVFSLELRPTPDLLAGLADRTRPDQFIVGFALEPQNRLETSARTKLDRKKLDAIVANPLETMDADRITAKILLRDGRTIAAPIDIPKGAFAQWLLEQLQTEIAKAGQPPR